MRARRLVLSLCAGAALVATFSAPASASSANGRHVFPGTKPGWTTIATKLGDVAADQGLTAQVWLAPRNQAELDLLATAVSDPTSSSYGQYLSAAAYNATFAPTSAQVAAVSDWLTGAGLQVDSVGPDNAYVSVSGSAAAINAAFATQVSTYQVNGNAEQAPSIDLSAPDSIANSVAAVTGLTSFGHRLAPADLGPPAGFRNATPCSSFYGEKIASALPKFNGQTLPFAPCGYTASQFRSTYGVTASGKTGAGQSVAITDAFDSPLLLSDANQYSTNRHDATFVGSQFQDLSVAECTTLTGFSCTKLVHDCGGNGWYGEQILDIDAVHGMAQDANVLYYGAGSCYDNDLLASLARVVSDNKASIVTNSWGEPTFVKVCDATGKDCQVFATIDQNTVTAYEDVFKRGAVQGIGFYFSSGDSGDELANVGFKHPDWPAGDVWVTAVGGTSLAVDQNGNRSFETGWGTSQWRSTNGYETWDFNIAEFQYGSGGGFSDIFGEPVWQKGVVTGDPGHGRAVPDVAMDGDPTTGMLVGQTQVFEHGAHAYGEYRIGGTSLSSPLFAGLQADAQSGRGHRIGFASPLIYSLFSRHSDIYYDPTQQGDEGNIRADFRNGLNSTAGIRFSVRTFNQDSSLTTLPGWDDVTGVGTPTAGYISTVNKG